MADKYQSMTDAQLQKEAGRLAKERTAIRLAQNAVEDEIGARAAAAKLPPGVVKRIQVGGAIGPTGETRSN